MPLSRKNPKRKKSWRKALNYQVRSHVRQGKYITRIWKLDARTGTWKLPDWVSAVTAKLFPRKAEN